MASGSAHSSLNASPLAQVFLYADPVGHSRSPVMHRAAFANLGIAAEYLTKRVETAELAEAMQDLRAAHVLGANISLPHKEAAWQLVDKFSLAAQRIGAINTVVNKGGQLWGDNTDAQGLLLALQQDNLLSTNDRHSLGPTESTEHILIVGAGGAARAAVYMARQLLPQPRPVWLVNRSLARAQQLAAAWPEGVQALERQTILGGREAVLTNEDLLEKYQPSESNQPTLDWQKITLLINASSAGLNQPQETALPNFDWSLLPSNAKVYDMVYQPTMTLLRRQAQAAGLQHAGGLSMLAQQARLSFMAWTSQEVEYEIFWQALQPHSQSSQDSILGETETP